MTTEQARIAAEAMETIKRISARMNVDDVRRVLAVEKLNCTLDLNPAPVDACDTCPWRRENANSDDRLLSEEFLVEYWEDIREGRPFSCHKTLMLEEMLDDGDRERGWSGTPESVKPRECAGALAQVVKEERLRDALGSNEAYAEVRGPRGVTARGFERLTERRKSDQRPIRPPRNLEQYGRPWFPEPDGQDTLPIVPPCFCPVCTHHTDVHDPIMITPPGAHEAVAVDAGLAPLMEALWGAGAITFASCEDLRHAVTRLWDSTELERLEETPAYGHFVREGLAYVRGVDSPVWEPVAEVVQRLPLGQVIRARPAIQIAFPLADMPRLVAAL